MKILILQANEGNAFIFLVVGYIITFIIGVLITRWIFGIDKIVNSLQKQNDYTMVQVRLLKKMLLNQGTPAEEIDDIIQNGNQKSNLESTIDTNSAANQIEVNL